MIICNLLIVKFESTPMFLELINTREKANVNNAIQHTGKMAILVEDIGVQTNGAMPVVEKSGVEELLVFLALTGSDLCQYGTDIVKKIASNASQYVVVDMESAMRSAIIETIGGSVHDIDFGYHEPMVLEMYDKVDTERLKAVIKTAEELDNSFFEKIAGSLELEKKEKEKFVASLGKRKGNLRKIITDELRSRVQNAGATVKEKINAICNELEKNETEPEDKTQRQNAGTLMSVILALILTIFGNGISDAKPSPAPAVVSSPAVEMDMPMTVDEIQASSKLPPEERLRIAENILQNIDPELYEKYGHLIQLTNPNETGIPAGTFAATNAGFDEFLSEQTLNLMVSRRALGRKLGKTYREPSALFLASTIRHEFQHIIDTRRATNAIYWWFIIHRMVFYGEERAFAAQREFVERYAEKYGIDIDSSLYGDYDIKTEFVYHYYWFLDLKLVLILSDIAIVIGFIWITWITIKVYLKYFKKYFTKKREQVFLRNLQGTIGQQTKKRRPNRRRRGFIIIPTLPLAKKMIEYFRRGNQIQCAV